MQQKDWLVVGAVVLVMIIAFVGWSKPAQVIDATKVDVNQISQRVYDSVIANLPLGAMPGNSLDGPEFCVGGVCTYSVSRNMTATSAVPFAVQNPVGATSTLKSFTCGVTALGGITAVHEVDVSTSTTQYGSSTPAFIKAHSTVLLELPVIVWNGEATTTSRRLVGINGATGRSDNIIGPTEYVTLRIATGSASTLSSYWTGVCNATFQRVR